MKLSTSFLIDAGEGRSSPRARTSDSMIELRKFHQIFIGIGWKSNFRQARTDSRTTLKSCVPPSSRCTVAMT